MSPSSKVPLGVVRYNVSQSLALNSGLLILVLAVSSKSSFRISYILALPERSTPSLKADIPSRPVSLRSE